MSRAEEASREDGSQKRTMREALRIQFQFWNFEFVTLWTKVGKSRVVLAVLRARWALCLMPSFSPRLLCGNVKTERISTRSRSLSCSALTTTDGYSLQLTLTLTTLVRLAGQRVPGRRRRRGEEGHSSQSSRHKFPRFKKSPT